MTPAMTVQRTRPISWSPTTSTGRPLGASDIAVHDDFLDRGAQTELFEFLSGPGWAFGAYSDPNPGASRYWYKHFAGIVRDAREYNATGAFEQQLDRTAPLVSSMWAQLRSTILNDHQLVRCYANGYPSGAEGGLHTDSNVPNHFTTIYYPHLAWHPNFGGETLFFTHDGADILKAVFPKPNRLVVFPGMIPHVARGVSRLCPQLRITLMFKSSQTTLPPL
jgi:SM-20-related protein